MARTRAIAKRRQYGPGREIQHAIGPGQTSNDVRVGARFRRMDPLLSTTRKQTSTCSLFSEPDFRLVGPRNANIHSRLRMSCIYSDLPSSPFLTNPSKQLLFSPFRLTPVKCATNPTLPKLPPQDKPSIVRKGHHVHHVAAQFPLSAFLAPSAQSVSSRQYLRKQIDAIYCGSQISPELIGRLSEVSCSTLFSAIL